MSTDKPQLIRIDNQETRTLDRKLVIGRHPGCDYVLTLNDRNIGISGRHASIEAVGEIAWVEDLGSTNGTWVLGERIAKRTRLASGDRFQLDRLEFEFRAAAVKPAPAPAPTPPAPKPIPRAPTTVSVALEDLALPPPMPLKPEPVRTVPPRPEPVAAPPPPPPPPPKPEPMVAPPAPPPAPPPPAPEPARPPVVEVTPAVVARPAELPPVPKTVEVQVLEEKLPPSSPEVEPVATPPPPPPSPPPKPEPVAAPTPPKPEPARSDAPKPANTDNKPQKVAGGWISADHSGKTKLLMPGERARVQEQMGSGLYGTLETVSVPTLLFTVPEERRVTLAQRDSATQAWTIGSNADADVSIASDGLSGLHAKILRNGQTWTISDLMSANGTFVNGEKINISHLEAGNQLGFGPVLCTFLLPEGAMSPAAPKPAAASKPARRPVALPLPLLLGGALLGLALLGFVIYLLLRR